MVDYASFLDGVVHEPIQRSRDGFDLTASAIHEVTDPGHIDFGGDELAPAETEPHPGSKRDPDDYEWWVLDVEHYLFSYSESSRRTFG